MMSTFTTPTQWRLEIPETIARSAWQQSQTCPTPRAQWNTYLNQICLDILQPLLQSEYLHSTPYAVTPYPEAIGSLWELVTGTGLLGGAKRLVLIPDKSFDRQLSVPQEWVDHPEWAGDYYLAIEVNPDEQWLEVWGYTTHAMLKSKAAYQADDRTYQLDTEDVIQDLNVLWVTQQMNSQAVTQSVNQAVIPSIPASIPAIEGTQTDNLLQRLATVDRPRLEVPFLLWMACIQQPEWRSRLSARRRGEALSTNLSTDLSTDLSQWLQNTFESGWQSLENLLGSEAEFVFRQTATIDIPAIRRVKALRLPTRLLLLLVAVDAEADGRMGIRVQVRSGDETAVLPLGLIITLQSSSGEVIQRVQARGDDLAVQLQRFRCAARTTFQINVRLDDRLIEEQFVA
jgi:Protein of unknown function (DUF1822)